MALKMKEATGRDMKSLRESPLIEPLYLHIFEWFEDLSYARFNYVGMDFAFAPILQSEVQAYMQLHHITPHPDELKLLRGIDSIFLELMNKKDEKK